MNREINLELVNTINDYINNTQFSVRLHCNKTNCLDAVNLLKDSFSVDGSNELMLLKLTNSNAVSIYYFYGHNKRWTKINDQYLNESSLGFFNFSHSYALGESILFDLNIIAYLP